MLRRAFTKRDKRVWKNNSHAPHGPARKVTCEDIQQVRRLARNPEIGTYLHSMAYDAVHDAFMTLPALD